MMARRMRPWLACLTACIAMAAVAAPGARASSSTTLTGTTSDGGTWVADIPASWNGTLLLYGHGFGPLVAVDAPDPATRAALLARGYALAGSSYDPTGPAWALDSALGDQFQTLSDVRSHLPAAPTHVIAFGTSMGGLISALEDENSNGRIDGALTTCGAVAGGIEINNNLDGEYAISRLLAPGAAITLVGFTSGPSEALATGERLQSLGAAAQGTAPGRARLALAMALMNVPAWAPGQAMPARRDYDEQEQQQYAVQFDIPPTPGAISAMEFDELGRQAVEQAAGGNSSWTAGVNFKRLLDHSSYASEVRALYREAGLRLDADLASLTKGANITADTSAVRSIDQTSVPTGRLQVPEIDIHTIGDQIVPVQEESYYARTVQSAGASHLLRQVYVDRQSHCNFTTAELVAGVIAIQRRVDGGHWGLLADPDWLNRLANGLNLGAAAFIRYLPPQLSNDNGPFSPSLNWIGG